MSDLASICVFPQKTNVFTNQTLSALEMNFLSTLLQFGIIKTPAGIKEHIFLWFSPFYVSLDHVSILRTCQELQIYILHWCLKPLRSEEFFLSCKPSWSQNLGFSSLLPKFPSFTSCTKSLLVLLIYIYICISIYSNDTYIWTIAIKVFKFN